MSNKKRVNRKRRRSPWSKLFSKGETRLSARVTREEDWQTDVPNIRLSRAFVIVLLMHLVVGGALIAFTLMNPNEANAQGKSSSKQEPAKVAATEKKPGGSTKEKKGASGAGLDRRMDDMRRHIVHSGDSVAKIAQQYGVSSEEIHAVNRIDEVYQLYQGRVLRIPLSASSPVPLSPQLAEKKPAVDSSSVVSDETPRGPLTTPHAEVVEPSESEDAPDADPLLEPDRPEVLKEISRPLHVTEVPPVVEEEREPEIVRPIDPPAPPVADDPPSRQKTYKVVKGDNPFRIAKRFGVHYKELLRHNGITDPSKLQIGQVLTIPN